MSIGLIAIPVWFLTLFTLTILERLYQILFNFWQRVFGLKNKLKSYIKFQKEFNKFEILKEFSDLHKQKVKN